MPVSSDIYLFSTCVVVVRDPCVYPSISVHWIFHVIYSNKILLSTATSIDLCYDISPCCTCGITPELSALFVYLIPK